MKTPPPSRSQVAGAVALLFGTAAAFAAFAAFHPAVPFLTRDDAAPWIGYPIAPDGMMGLAPRDALPVTRFVRTFDVPGTGAPDATLRLRALRTARVAIDGAWLPLPPADHWRENASGPRSTRGGDRRSNIQLAAHLSPSYKHRSNY